MITERDLTDAIQKIEGGPASYTACEKLSVLYNVYDHLYGEPEYLNGYSMAGEPKTEKPRIYTTGRSDFLKSVDGKDSDAVMRILDELLGTIQVLNPRVYDNTIARLRNCPE